MPFMGLAADAYRTIENKTAAYQMVENDHGKILTNLGASASVTFTLPVTSTIQAGWMVTVYVAADDEVVIASQGSSDNIIAANDAGADSITITTATEHLGMSVDIYWSGTKFLTQMHLAAEAFSITVA